MATPLRSIRPKCPECGFSVFNRRFAKCESCGALLPVSIVYTADELKQLADKEKAEEESTRKARAREQGDFTSNDSSWLGDLDIDFSD